MDYQHFTIIFVLIVLPLSIVLSYHIQNQADTIDLQSSYQSKLESSTYDAVTSYQINSLNSQRVSGESVKAYVSASINTFFTSLANNFGMTNASKSRLQSYVPAILFTTYDGYYIYSPTKTKEIAINQENGQGIVTPEGNLVYTKEGTDEDIYRVNKDLAQSYTNGTAKVSGNYTINVSDAKDVSNYMLKPFIYYSAKYVKGSDFVVTSYSLDNYLSVYGIKNGSEFSKSGYIIDPDKIEIKGDLLIKLIAKNGSQPNDLSKSDFAGYNSNNSEEFQNYIEQIYNANLNPSNPNNNNIKYLHIDVKSDDAYNYINDYSFGEDINHTVPYGNYYANKVNENNIKSRTQTGDRIIEETLNINEFIGEDASTNSKKNNLIINSISSYHPLEVSYNEIKIEDKDAKEYYIKAYFYSRWIQDNLADIQAKNIDQQYIFSNLNALNVNDTTKRAFVDFTNDETKIFNIGSNNNPESEASDFQQHKRNVIKNQIQYNLNSAISTYTENFYNLEHEYRLPIISEQDWDRILDNVSMTTFFQGVPAGTKTFNSYAVIESTNNNTSVDIDNMYFVANNEWDNGSRKLSFI